MKTPLRHRDFALMWTAGLISISGNWMLVVAVPITVLGLTGSSAATAAVTAAALAPRILAGPIAGVLADRWDRRRALIGANLLQVGLVLPLLAVDRADDLWIVVAVVFAMGCASQVIMTAEGALLPTLVPDGEIARANALNALNNNLGRLVGPALGGVLTASTGIGTVAALDAATFLAAAGLTAMVRTARRGPAREAPGPAGFWRDLGAGLATIRAVRPLRVVFGFLAIISLGEGVMTVLIVVYVERALGGGPRELGWLVAAQAVGGIVGGLLGGVLGDRFAARWLVGLGTVAVGLGDLVIFNYPRWYPEVWPALVLMAAVGLPAALLNAGVLTVLQTTVGDRLRGRVLGAAFTLMSLVALVGTGIAAALGDTLGPVALLNVQGVGLVAGGLYVIVALRTAVNGVTGATERTLTTAGRSG